MQPYAWTRWLSYLRTYSSVVSSASSGRRHRVFAFGVLREEMTRRINVRWCGSIGKGTVFGSPVSARLRSPADEADRSRAATRFRKRRTRSFDAVPSGSALTNRRSRRLPGAKQRDPSNHHTQGNLPKGALVLPVPVEPASAAAALPEPGTLSKGVASRAFG